MAVTQVPRILFVRAVISLARLLPLVDRQTSPLPMMAGKIHQQAVPVRALDVLPKRLGLSCASLRLRGRRPSELRGGLVGPSLRPVSVVATLNVLQTTSLVHSLLSRSP